MYLLLCLLATPLVTHALEYVMAWAHHCGNKVFAQRSTAQARVLGGCSGRETRAGLSVSGRPSGREGRTPPLAPATLPASLRYKHNYDSGTFGSEQRRRLVCRFTYFSCSASALFANWYRRGRGGGAVLSSGLMCIREMLLKKKGKNLPLAILKISPIHKAVL